MDFYVLECSVQECVAEFYLNDVPVVRRGPELGQHFAGQSNPHLVDGENELSVLIEPGPEPHMALTGNQGQRSRRAAKGARVDAALCRYPFGATVGGPSRTELVSMTWTVEEDDPMVFPRVITTTVDLGELYGRWSWEDSEPRTLGEEDRRGVTEALDALRQSLDAGDPEPFIAMSGIRLEENARAFDVPAAKKKKIIRKVTAGDSSQDGWGMAPLDEDHFSFRLCGKNRMIEAIARDWNPVLRELPDPQGGVAYYGLIFSFLEDSWKIIR